eukprot:2763215-Rhodomonas_salina.1
MACAVLGEHVAWYGTCGTKLGMNSTETARSAVKAVLGKRRVLRDARYGDSVWYLDSAHPQAVPRALSAVPDAGSVPTQLYQTLDQYPHS